MLPTEDSLEQPVNRDIIEAARHCLSRPTDEGASELGQVYDTTVVTYRPKVHTYLPEYLKESDFLDRLPSLTLLLIEVPLYSKGFSDVAGECHHEPMAPEVGER